MAKYTMMDNIREAPNLLRELIETPNTRSIHFEFDASVDTVPMAKYTIERIVLKDDEESEE